MSLLRGPRLLGPLLMKLAACAGAPPQPLAQPEAPSPESSRAPEQLSPEQEPEQKAEEDPVERGAGKAEEPPATATEPAPPAAEAPLTPEEQEAMEKRCKPFITALNTKTRGASPSVALAELEKLLQKPPAGMKKDDVDACGGALARSIRAFHSASVEVEAKLIVHRVALGMVKAFERDKKLCPPTARPVPPRFAQVAKEPYESKASDWEAPTWQCVGFAPEGQRQRFQYEVKTDDATQSFEVIARGSPLGDGRAVEIVQRGAFKTGKGFELSPPTRR